MNSSGGINPKINSEKKNKIKINDEDKSNEKMFQNRYKMKIYMIYENISLIKIDEFTDVHDFGIKTNGKTL